MRSLIVNADDLGQSEGVTAGILDAHARGVVTSASLMVRWPAASAAVDAAREHPELDLGLHLDLGEWVLEGDSWRPLYAVVDLDDHGAVADEVARQLDAFERLTGREPTHLDSHQHVHLRAPALLEAATQAAARLAIPLRGRCDVRYRGDFYGQAEDGTALQGVLSVAGLGAILASLEEGVSELACHPACGDDLDTMYGGRFRNRELEVLCAPELRELLAREDIVLATFAREPA